MTKLPVQQVRKPCLKEIVSVWTSNVKLCTHNVNDIEGCTEVARRVFVEGPVQMTAHCHNV